MWQNGVFGLGDDSQQSSNLFSDIESSSLESAQYKFEEQQQTQQGRRSRSSKGKSHNKIGGLAIRDNLIHYPSSGRSQNPKASAYGTSHRDTHEDDYFGRNPLLGASRVEPRTRPVSSPTPSPPRSAKYASRLSARSERPWALPRPQSGNGEAKGNSEGADDPPRSVSSAGLRKRSASPKKSSAQMPPTNQSASVSPLQRHLERQRDADGCSSASFTPSWMPTFNALNVQNPFSSTSKTQKHQQSVEKKDSTKSFFDKEGTGDLGMEIQKPDIQQQPSMSNFSNNDPFLPSPTKSPKPSPSSSLRQRRNHNQQHQQAPQDPLSLHNLLSCASTPSDPRWMEALELLSTSPDPHHLASQTINSSTSSNWTALHIASLSNPPLFVVYGLLLVHPNGARERDNGGRLPLHLAAGVGAGVAILSALVRFYGDGVVCKEGRGLIPLHLALSRGAGRRLVGGINREPAEELAIDNEEEYEAHGISMEMLRILLGQRSYSSVNRVHNPAGGRRRTRSRSNGSGRTRSLSGGRKVKDGDMRRGGHLNLELDEIQGNVFGENPNSKLERERRRKEAEMRVQNERNETAATTLTNTESREDGNPRKDEFLASLWEVKDSSGTNIGSADKFRMFGTAEIEEAETFSQDVQDCLRHLAQWRKRQGKRGGINTTFSEEEEDREGERKHLNPAAMPAPPHMRLPIHMAIRMNHQPKRQHLSSSIPEHTSKTKNANQNEILRVLIHAYPQSLVHQDLQGRTPLMTCLQLAHHPATYPIDLEMTELLLGIRTAGYRSTPEWLNDADLVAAHHRFQRRDFHDLSGVKAENLGVFDHVIDGENGRPYNSAVIPSNQSLPLHIAAQESLSSSIIHAIYASYPGAIYVQDERRCTPLHCTLRNTTASTFLDLEVIQLLMDERVLRMKDDLNQSILDLFVINANSRRFPLHVTTDRGVYHSGDETPVLYYGCGLKSNTRRQSSHIYQMVFHYYLVDDTTTSPLTEIAGDTLLCKLRVLPPWLRQIALLTPSVQKVLLKELAKPKCTAIIMLYGITLVTLIVSFTLLLDEHVSYYSLGANDNNGIGVGTRYHQIVIIIVLVYLIIHEICILSTTFRLHVAWNQFFGNIWSWVTVAGLVTTAVATMRLHGQRNQSSNTPVDSSRIMAMDDAATFAWSTAAIGFLWTMLVGYLSRWWYGMNLFCSGVIKMAQDLVLPLLVVLILIVSFLQMLYLIERQTLGLDERCVSPDGYIDRSEKVSVCSVWDSFKIIFLFIVGESFLTRDGDDYIDKSALAVVLLVCTFVTLAFLLLLQIVCVSIRSTTNRTIKESDMFFAPILTFIYFIRNLRPIFCRDNREAPKPYMFRRRLILLESIWDYLVSSMDPNVNLTDTKWWYLQEGRCSPIFANKWIVRLIAMIVIPIWLTIGLVTLGLGWPSQVRIWIFNCTSGNFDDNFADNLIEQSPLSQKSSELSQLKAMIYERFHNIQDDLQNIKDAPPN